MKTATMEKVEQIFQQMEKEHEQYRKQLAQSFANDMCRVGETGIADKVEKSGLPIEIWAGTEIYQKAKELFIHICPVFENYAIGKQEIIASWFNRVDFKNNLITEVEEQELPWLQKWQPIPMRPNYKYNNSQPTKTKTMNKTNSWNIGHLFSALIWLMVIIITYVLKLLIWAFRLIKNIVK